MLDTSYVVNLDVRDTPGMLIRVIQVFTRRGCHVSSIQVKSFADRPFSHMTIKVQNVIRIDQIVSQLEKLIDVNSVTLDSKEKTDYE